MSLKLSIVSGTVNRPESFKRMADSVIRETTVPFELVVTDASDTPVTYADSRVRLIREWPRQGHAAGYNMAFQACRGEWVIWLNDDAEVCPSYDLEAIAFMEAHPQIGLGALHYSEDNSPFHVNSAWGCLYANFGILKRETGNAVGWFDQSMTMYCADNSLTFRVLLQDKGVADIPRARVIHHSVKDALRVENQRYRIPDNQRLHDIYMPWRQHWLKAFRKYRVDTSVEPWAHGIKPVTA